MKWEYPPLDINPVFSGLGNYYYYYYYYYYYIIIIIVIIIIIKSGSNTE